MTHKDAAARLSERAVRHQACDDMLGSRRSLVVYFYSLRCIDARDRAGSAVDPAVDPHLAVVIHVGFEPHPEARHIDAVHFFGQLDGDAVPDEGESFGNALADVGANIPTRVI